MSRRPAPTVIVAGSIEVDHYEPVASDSAHSAPLPPLVVVHGAMDRAAGFRRTIRHLPDRRVLAYDRRGYGRRVDVEPAHELGDHLVDLEQVLTALDEPAVVVGHSFGGLIAMWGLATPSLANRLLGAVVWEAPLAWEPWYSSRGSGLVDLDPADAAEAFMRGVLGTSLWERLPATMQAERRAEGRALMSDLRVTRTPSAAIPFERIVDPVLVGYGERSGEHHRRSAIEAAERMSAATLVTVPDADHGVHLSKPAAFATFIASWNTDTDTNTDTIAPDPAEPAN